MERPSLDEIFGQMPTQSRPSLDDIFGAPEMKKVAGNDMGAFASGVQGFNSIVPFGNRITAGLAAGVTAPFTDLTVSDLYKTARENQKATEEAHPGANLAGAGLGIAATLPIGLAKGAANTTMGIGKLANAAQKGSSAAGNFVRGATTTGGQVARAAGVAGGTGAIYGYGGSRNDLDSAGAFKDAAITGALGAAVGGAVPIVGAGARAVGKELSSLRKATPQTSKELRNLASPLYDKFTKSGGVYSDKLTNELADLADSARSVGVAGQTKQADDALNNALDFYAGLRGKKLSPSDVQKLDQSFADDIARFNRQGEYNFGRILNNLKYEFRNRAFNPQSAANYVESGNPAAINDLAKANKLWQQSYKSADIEKIIQKAQGTENPQTSIRTGLKNLLANDKKMAGYSTEEKAILQEALKRGHLGGLIKIFGGRLTDSLAGGMAGLSAGGPVGGIVGAVAGKAVGGALADVAGGIQANRLQGALQSIQRGAQPMQRLTAPSAPLLSGQAAGQIGNKGSVEVAPAAAAGAMSLPAIMGEMNETPSNPTPALPGGVSGASYLDKVSRAESNHDYNAKAKTSSAFGKYQITSGTASGLIKKYGKNYGIDFTNWKLPQHQETLAQLLTQENTKMLADDLKRQPTEADLYAAHFLGASRASRLISALGTGRKAAAMFPDAARANRSIFYNEKMQPRTVEEVYTLLAKKIA